MGGFAEEGSRTETFETTLYTHFTAHCNTITRRQVNMLGKTGVTANRDKIEFRLFNSSSIFNITLREELLSSLKHKTNHASLSCFHGASHLSQVPRREVEGHYSPGDEPSVTLALLHNELSSCASHDSGVSVDITLERHRTGQLTDSLGPEMVQGISGTTHAWPTRVQLHTKSDCGMPHLLQTEAGFEVFNQLYMPNAPEQILSLSQLVEAGYVSHFRPSAQKS